nr:endo-1,4-beta-xylanase [uncultured bacterium]
MTNLKIKSVTLAFVLLLFAFWAFSCAESDVHGSDLPSDEGFTENVDTSLSETITDEEAETMPGDDSYSVELSEVRTNVVERKSRPTEFSAGSSYDEIIYYGGTKESNEEKIKKLPHGVRIMDESCVIENISDLRAELGEASVVDVDDTTMPFDRAVSITVKKVPTTSYEFQITLGESALVGKTEPGNILLVHLYARSVNEGESGRMELIIEKDGTNGDYSKLLKHYVDFGNEWTEIFAPVEFKNGYTSVNLRFGFKLQNIEIGGFEIVDYGNDVRCEDMPVSKSGNSSDAAWREEALERIDEVRKGDVKVVVTDSNGNPISGAKTEIEMYEHEFEWGTAVSSGGLSNPKMLDAVGSLFNAAVLENELKWSMYEQNTQRPINMIKKLNELGIYTVRGHCLVWDRNRRTNDTSVPEDLPTLYNDKDKLFDRIESHIFEVMENMEGYITEWDVLNEACNNTTMQNIYGRELIKEWFAIARDTGIDADLYYNDFKTNDELFALLDKMEQMGVDYDGIGVQSHYSGNTTVTDIDNFYKKLSSYGKKLKVTEYDFQTDDPIRQAEFTRDLMILTFSYDAFEGFYLWGIKGGDGNRYVCYDNSWNPRPALEQMQDLIYNKWMTRDSGRTDANGVAEFEGFYGSYKISVIANGVKKTVLVDCHKGSDNTILIEIP